MQFFATILSTAVAITAVSAHGVEYHNTTTTVTAPAYGGNTTVAPTGTGAATPSSSTTPVFDSGASKLSGSALGLLAVGGAILAL